MEVILALAIFGLAIAFIGELVRLGSRGAAAARDLAIAQLLCESKLAEIAAGAVAPEPYSLTPFEEEPEWLYAIDVQPAQQQGLLAVVVTVQQDNPESSRPVSFSLTRWIVDPAFAETLEAQQTCGCCQ